ncbi:M50 family metallopeptidase [Rothia aerolata]|nr:site-2 protease family protein [Rothia aerolata]
MGIVLFIVGVLLMAVAIALSIALHEIGHLVPAKLFGVRVPQYMIGFGKTVFSRKIGETEYGVKAVPLGGYISMIGMYPPEKGAAKPGRLADLYRQAREADAERITKADQGRLFYQLPVVKRIIIMLGGPTMNLLIGIVAMAVLIMGFGQQQPTTAIATISQCVQSVSSTNVDQEAGTECDAADPASPASAAGLKPGDEIVGFAGESVTSWDQLSEEIKTHANQETPVTVVRDGRQVELTITPMLTTRPILNDLSGQFEKNADCTYQTEDVGFIGISPTTELKPGSVSEVLPAVGQSMQQMGSALVKLPVKVYGVAETLVTNGQRAEDSPVSVVGVGRVAGEIAATDQIDLHSKAASLVSLVATMNLMLFLFNLVPLLPLDGGHVLGALWEGARKLFAKIFRRPQPGPFDPVKLLPLTWVVAGAFLGMSVILIAADLFKPITVF